MIIYKINILKNQDHRFLNFIDLSLRDKIIVFFIITFFIISFLLFSSLSFLSSFSSFSFRLARSRLRLFSYYCCDETYNKNVSFFSDCNESDFSFSNYDDTRNASDVSDINGSNCDNTRNANDVSDMNESNVKGKIIFFLIELLFFFISSKRSRSR